MDETTIISQKISNLIIKTNIDYFNVINNKIIISSKNKFFCKYKNNTLLLSSKEEYEKCNIYCDEIKLDNIIIKKKSSVTFVKNDIFSNNLHLINNGNITFREIKLKNININQNNSDLKFIFCNIECVTNNLISSRTEFINTITSTFIGQINNSKLYFRKSSIDKIIFDMSNNSELFGGTFIDNVTGTIYNNCSCNIHCIDNCNKDDITIIANGMLQFY